MSPDPILLHTSASNTLFPPFQYISFQYTSFPIFPSLSLERRGGHQAPVPSWHLPLASHAYPRSQYFVSPHFGTLVSSKRASPPSPPVPRTGEEGIKHLFARGTHRRFGYRSLLVYGTYYFVFAVLVAGSAVASGLFVPMLMIGAVLGRIFGLATVDIAQGLGTRWSVGKCNLFDRAGGSCWVWRLGSWVCSRCALGRCRSGKGRVWLLAW